VVPGGRQQPANFNHVGSREDRYIRMVNLRTSRQAVLAVAIAVLIAAYPSAPHAQSLPTLRLQDTARWETLVPSATRLGLSPDGTVLAYRVDRSNWDDELRVTRRSDGRSLVIPFGRDPEYSEDGRWLMYSIGHSSADEAQLKADHRPVRDGLGVLQLSTFTETRFAEVEDAAFSADSGFLAVERYTPRPAGGRGGGRRSTDADTLHLYLRSLASANAADTAFDNVEQFEWQPDHGHRIAMIMGGDSQGATRVLLVDPAAAAANAIVIDDAPTVFRHLAWSGDGNDLAYLRRHPSATDDRGFDVVTARGAGAGARALSVYDASKDARFPAGTRIVDARTPSWSSDGRTVFVGIADAAPAARADDTDGAEVRIWHWTDVKVIPRQAEDLNDARAPSRLAAVNLADSHLVPLATSLTARVTPIDGTSLALVADWTAYAMARTLGRPAADLSLVDIRTGQRTPFATGVDDNQVHIRPDGGALVFLRDDHVWALNTRTHALTDLSAASGARLIDTDADTTAPHKPLFGIGGWSSDGALIAYDRYDIWRIGADGTGARALTNGAAARIRHRIATITDDNAGDRTIDFTQPVYVELFGERTKQSGYARLMPGGALERLIYQDRHIDSLATAAKGSVYAYITQDFDVSPNIFIGGATLADARAATATNPQQSRYAWGRSTVIDYTTARGDALQAALYYPAGYTAGRRYPTIVKLYERLSDEVHDYVSPSDMDESNIAIFTELGYCVIAPDIRYRPRDPGVSTVDAVTAAVARAVALGVTDAAHVGVIGHSWGAYGSAFLATHTANTFAAAVAGAPITDLISQYGDHHWNTGIAETDHIETGQQRMQVPYWDDVDAYVRNSPIFGVATMTTPLLIEAGDQDGEVFWHQSVELYNAARRAEKPVVLLQYLDEDHALENFDNRRDYQRRILAWFGHFLKGETAPPWITTGTPLIKRSGT
jgi:dipeptidyl aminopeptidase/acylaminoacyl peptidase